MDREQADVHSMLGSEGAGRDDGRQPEMPCSAWAEFSQFPRDTAMWCLHVLCALCGLAFGQQVVHLQEAGTPPFMQRAKRILRQGVEPPPTSSDQMARSGDVMTPLHGGNQTGPTQTRQWNLDDAWTNEVSGGRRTPARDEVNQTEVAEEATSFMQEDAEAQWLVLLDEIRLKLEGLGKGERSQTAAHMLRLLNHRATDVASGLYLGQMTGRVAMLTSLLVAMWEDEIYGVKVPTGDEKLEWLRPTWERVTRFIGRHPGSSEAAGKWPSHDFPNIMPPTGMGPATVAPRSPIQLDDSYEPEQPRPTKRRVLRVELSSGSADQPRTASLNIPWEEDTGTVTLSFSVLNAGPNESVSSASTVPVQRNQSMAGGCRPGALPPGAPFSLDFFGLSAGEFERLHLDWHAGEIAEEEVTATHGPWVSEELVKRWGQPGAWLNPSPLSPPGESGDMLPHGAVEAAGGLLETAVDDDQTPGEEGDANGLFHVWTIPAVGVLGTREPEAPRERVDFFTMARRVVAHLEGCSVPMLVISSALMELIWARADHDYTMAAEEYYDRMEIPMHVDRDRADEMEETTHALVIWLEAELWQEFIDELEGMVGESEQVMRARAQPTMETETCNLWWQWAEANTPLARPRSRSRSRSRGEEPDDASLMEAGRGRPVPKQKSYPGRGHRDSNDERDDDGRDDRGGRGGRRVERYSEAARRRQPRSRSERIAARSAASASAGPREGRSPRAAGGHQGDATLGAEERQSTTDDGRGCHVLLVAYHGASGRPSYQYHQGTGPGNP